MRAAGRQISRENLRGGDSGSCRQIRNCCFPQEEKRLDEEDIKVRQSIPQFTLFFTGMVCAISSQEAEYSQPSRDWGRCRYSARCCTWEESNRINALESLQHNIFKDVISQTSILTALGFEWSAGDGAGLLKLVHSHH